MKPYELARAIGEGIDRYRAELRKGATIEEARATAAREVCKAEIDRQIKEHARDVDRRLASEKAAREPLTHSPFAKLAGKK